MQGWADPAVFILRATYLQHRVRLPGRAKSITVREIRLSCHWLKDCFKTPSTIPAFCLDWLYVNIVKKWVEGRVTGPTTSPETPILTKTKTANSIR